MASSRVRLRDLTSHAIPRQYYAYIARTTWGSIVFTREETEDLGAIIPMSLSHAVYRDSFKAAIVQNARHVTAFEAENVVSTFSVRLVPEELEQGIERTIFAVKTIDE